MRSEFTGRHMLGVMVVGFGIVVAVNMTMATLATRGFGGVIVENSYVASQNFNSWLDEAERQRALGWQVEMARTEEGKLQVVAHGVPEGTSVTAQLRRPLGQRETIDRELRPVGPNLFLADEPLPQGRWIARLSIAGGGEQMQLEEELQ